MKLATVIFFVIYICSAAFETTDFSEKWESFKTVYNKVYINENEENYRRTIFFKNLQSIEEHNQKYSKGLVTYTVDVNEYADHNVEEFVKPFRPSPIKNKKIRKLEPKGEVPESIDWRDYGVIPPVKDQGKCFSCWAFAVTGALEPHLSIHLGQNLSLSEENLVDCVYSDFTCETEMERTALEDCYKYIIENGIDDAESYPYDQNPLECSYNPETVAARITDYAVIPEGDEEELKRVVGTLGPVSILLCVDFTFMVYKTGIYYRKDCIDMKLQFNHAVTIIGYGVEDGQDYWLVRNEWGTFFGNNGYIKMARNRDNLCGVASYASYPII